jgi:outer membrane receptor protein involved in Fe transport
VFTDQVSIEERRIDLARSGWTYGWFFADRFRLGERLTIEAGARWDRQTYSDDSQWSPRLNAVVDLGPRTALRASWGHYWQSQGIQELQVVDGVDIFHPAQLNRQLTVALDQRFGDRNRLSVQAYAKSLTDLRPRYENLFDTFDIFPEGQSDRVLVAPERGRSRGLELLFERRRKRLDWWFSYALSKAEDRIDGAWVPRSWDQRHAVSYSFNLRPSAHWNLNLAGVHRSGWPTTDVVLVTDPGATFPRLEPGPRNSDTRPAYHRFDLRASRSFVVPHGEIKLFLEVTNIFDHDNQRSVSDFEISRTPDGFAVEREVETWFPRLPSFGVTWTF